MNRPVPTPPPLDLIDTALDASEQVYNPPWGGLTIEHACGAFCRISETDTHIIVAYRGTDQARDWLGNLRAYPWPYGGEWVHRGFQRGHASIWPRVLTEIQRRSGRKHLLLTGHSLGGALAELSLLFLGRYPGPMSMVTFGKPNVFFSPDRNLPLFAHRMQHQVSVVSGTDAIARMPALFFGPDPGQAMLYMATRDRQDYWIPRMTDTMRRVIAADRDYGGIWDHHDMGEYRKRFDRLMSGRAIK